MVQLRINSSHFDTISQKLDSNNTNFNLSFEAQDYIGLSSSLWDGNLTGKGVTAVILDTGISPNHDTFTYDGTNSWNERINGRPKW